MTLFKYCVLFLFSLSLSIYIGLNKGINRSIDPIFLEICMTVKLAKVYNIYDDDYLRELIELDKEYSQNQKNILKGTTDIEVLSLSVPNDYAFGRSIKLSALELKYILFSTSQNLLNQNLNSNVPRLKIKPSTAKNWPIFNIRGGGIKQVINHILLENWPKSIPLTRQNVFKFIVSGISAGLLCYGSVVLALQFSVTTPDQVVAFYDAISMNAPAGIFGKTQFVLSILKDPIKYKDFLKLLGFDVSRLHLFALALYSENVFLNYKIIHLILAVLLPCLSAWIISKLSFYALIIPFIFEVIVISELIFVDCPYILIWFTQRVIQFISMIVTFIGMFTDMPKNNKVIWAAYENFQKLIASGEYTLAEAAQILRDDLAHIRMTGAYPPGYKIANSPGISPGISNVQQMSNSPMPLKPMNNELLKTKIKAPTNLPLIK